MMTREELNKILEACKNTGKRVDLSGFDLRGLDLEKLDLSGAILRNTDFSFANVRYVKLNGADMTGAKLMGADFTLADLTGADMRNVNAEHGNFTNANLQKVNMAGSNWRFANFTAANMIGADLRKGDLTYANLDAYLHETKLEGAMLEDTCLPFNRKSFDMIVDVNLASQMAYHFCRLQCDDPDFMEARSALLKFANYSNYEVLYGKLEDKKCAEFRHKI